MMPGRSLVTRVRAMSERRQDAVLGTAIGAGGILEAVVRGGGPNAVTVTLIVSALLGVAVAFRRRTPATALVAAMALLVAAATPRRAGPPWPCSSPPRSSAGRSGRAATSRSSA